MSDLLDADWRNLPPIPEDERPELPEDWRPSQTFLKYHDRCDRSALLYLQFAAGAGSHELNRGSIFHAVAERITRLAIAEGEARVPPETGKDELLAYMRENPHLQVNAAERDALRAMVANFCEGEYFDEERVEGVEIAFTLDLGGYTIQGHIDRVDRIDPTFVEVVDYKTSFAMPDSEEFIPQSFSKDGRPYFAGDFQTMLYALGVAEGETEIGRIGEGYERFRLVLRFPRFLRPEGLAQREVVVTRQQLLDFRLDVEGQLERLRDVNLRDGRWQPTPGSHCTECPAEFACPLPKMLRPDAQHASLDSKDDLERVAAAVYFMGRRKERLSRRLKAAAVKLGEEDPEALNLGEGLRGVRIGPDLAYLFVEKTTEEVRDKKAMREALEATAEYGEKFDWDAHYRRTTGTSFVKRKIPKAPSK